MTTQCNATKLTFHELDSREVVGRFDGGEITSDAGGVLLREVEKRTGIEPPRESRRLHSLSLREEKADDFTDKILSGGPGAGSAAGVGASG